MSDTPNEPSRSSEVETIRQLVRLMQKYDLTAIDLGEGSSKIRLRRRGAGSGTGYLEAAPPPMSPAPAASGAHRTEPKAPAPAGTVIESPMVGTFYASPSPEAPPYVEVGSVVNDKTIVCVIEAMKVFTDIPAMVSGTITEVLAKNGQPVEFGQPLFRVSRLLAE